MENVTVKWGNFSEDGISQIYYTGMKFCFVSAENEQCHPFVFCKDFLQDCIYATIYNKSVGIYHFQYDPTINPKVDLESTRLLLINRKDDSFGDRVAQCQEFMDQICKKLRLKRTTFYKVENEEKKEKNCFLSVGSPMWMNSPVMISMYSLLIRAGMAHKLGEKYTDTLNKLQNGETKPYQRNDSSQIIGGIKGINKILNNGYRKFFYKEFKKNFPETVDMSTLHNYSGIVSFASDSTKTVVPYWHREKVAGLE